MTRDDTKDTGRDMVRDDTRDTSTPFEIKTVHIPDLKAYLDRMNMQGYEITTIALDHNLELATVIHKYKQQHEVV
jgi:hypothetical protein